MRFRLLLLAGLALPLAACQVQYIPNTDVEDSDDNQKIIEFCELYRKAVEKRNVALLMRLASPDYYEDGGNMDATDDIDYEGLKEHLFGKFRDSKAIRYEVRYRRVGDERGKRIYVDYTYAASYKIPTSKGDLWRREVADNRLVLIPDGEKYLILSGM